MENCVPAVWWCNRHVPVRLIWKVEMYLLQNSFNNVIKVFSYLTALGHYNLLVSYSDRWFFFELLTMNSTLALAFKSKVKFQSQLLETHFPRRKIGEKSSNEAECRINCCTETISRKTPRAEKILEAINYANEGRWAVNWNAAPPTIWNVKLMDQIKEKITGINQMRCDFKIDLKMMSCSWHKQGKKCNFY